MKKVKPVINYNGNNLYLEKGVYPNGRTAFLLINDKGQLWDDLSINLPNEKISKNEMFLNPNLPLNMLEELFDSGALINLFDDTTGYNKVCINNKEIDVYVIDNYTIQSCETEFDRDNGSSFTYDYEYSDFESALKDARELYEDNDLSSIEIVKNGKETVYCRDSKSEEFYFKNETLSCVSDDILDKYISAWHEKKELPLNINRLYCKKDNFFIGVDNLTNNCWTEEFKTEKDVQNWLLRNDLEKDLVNEI